MKNLKSIIEQKDVFAFNQYVQNHNLSYDSNALYYACKLGDFEWVQLVMEQQGPLQVTNLNGHQVELVITKGAWYWNKGLLGACEGGHRDLVEWMIEKGANYDWNRGLYYACLGGHRDLAEFMINKGAKNWNFGLVGACKGGHRDLAEFMINKGAKNWNDGLFYACSGGHRDLIELMMEKGADRCLCRKSLEEH